MIKYLNYVFINYIHYLYIKKNNIIKIQIIRHIYLNIVTTLYNFTS